MEVTASELQVGDLLVDRRGFPQLIVTIRKLAYVEMLLVSFGNLRPDPEKVTANRSILYKIVRPQIP